MADYIKLLWKKHVVNILENNRRLARRHQETAYLRLDQTKTPNEQHM